MRSIRVSVKFALGFAVSLLLLVILGVLAVLNLRAVAGGADVGGMLNRMIIEAAVIVILALAATVWFSMLASRVSRTLRFWATVLGKVAESGALYLDSADQAVADKYAEQTDEIGGISKAANDLLQMIIRKVLVLDQVAKGNLAHKFVHRSGNDTFSIAIQKTVDSLDRMFKEINSVTNQVTEGSTQTANGAMILAQGSTQQAASVEELSASITEIANKAEANAKMAREADALAEAIIKSAEKGSRQMSDMLSAVGEITQASQSIGRVIKVIDDIAFQTNILALNAAVEAARAGQHGKGFAVVAEEVRNLAAKSAEAARDTGSLIANSMEKAALGAGIAGETASSLEEIVSGIHDSNEIVVKIAKYSEAQSVEIMQIHNGVDQVAQVVQQNSATAQQSAAASKELSVQADLLKQLIARFKLKEGGAAAPVMAMAPPPAGMALNAGR